MIGSLLLIGGLLLGQSDLPGVDDLQLEVRRLVRRLDDVELAEREAAERALVEMGPRVLDLLPPIDDQTPAEVALRTGRIRQLLQRVMAESTMRPSLVTLSPEPTPVSIVLASIQKQTGNRIIDRREGAGDARNIAQEPLIRLACDQMPFWQALDRVLDSAELTVYPFGEEKAVYVTDRTESGLARADRASYAGPFRFEPVTIWAQRDLRDAENRSLRLTMEIAWEPQLSPINLQLGMADIKAFDENDDPLPIDGRSTELEIPVEPQAMAKQLRIPLNLPPRDVKRIARLTGRLTALAPGRVETFRFENIETAQNVEQRAAGVTVTLEQVRKNNALWEVRMRAAFDATSEALQSHRTWVYDNQAFLEDPEGNRIPYDAFDTTRQTENEFGVAYLFIFDGPLDGYRFVYKTPAVILKRSFDFELKDIDLP